MQLVSVDTAAVQAEPSCLGAVRRRSREQLSPSTSELSLQDFKIKAQEQNTPEVTVLYVSVLF